MHDPVIQFLVVALLVAIFLGALAKIPNLDATAVQVVRVLLIVVLLVMCINVLLNLTLGHGITFYTGRG